MSTATSKTRAPVSILKKKTGDTTRAEYSRGKTNRVTVEPNSRGSNGTSGLEEKALTSGGHLQAENSQLIAQNHHLLSELESTSQQLLQANSKLETLGGELSGEKREEAQNNKVEILEAQVQLMQDKLSKSASAQWKLDSLTNEQQREKEEWRTRQKLLEQQLSHVKQECKRLRESHAAVEEKANKLNSTFSTGQITKSSSTQSLPAAYQPSSSVAMTTNTRPHPQSSNSAHRSFLHSSSVLPLASSTLLKLSPPSLSGSTSSLNSVKSTKSAQEFSSRFSGKPSQRYQYEHRDTWTRQTGLTSSTPKSKPFTASVSLYQPPPLSLSSHPSFSSYSHPVKQASFTSATGFGSRTAATNRPGSTSGSYASLSRRERQKASTGGRGEFGRPAKVGATVLGLSDALDGHKSAMSYLSVGEGKQREAFVNGGCEGGSTGSDSGVGQGNGGGSEEARGQQRSPLSQNMELERAKSKIRLLEKEVVLLEQQLSDKTLSSQSYVEELTRMRTELAQERASIAIFKQELEEGVAKEIGRAKALHNKQCAELADQLEQTREEKRELEKETVKLKAEVKARNAEVSSLSERVSSLHKQLDQERRSHDEAMQLLQSEVKGGSHHVNQLEEALRVCQEELEGHVTRVEETARMQKSEVQELQKHVGILTSELDHTQHQLLNKTELATRLQRELSEQRGEFQREAASWREKEAELKQNLHHGDVLRQSLIQQVERSNQELSSLSSRLSDHQKMSREYQKCQLDLDSLKRHTIELESERDTVKSSLVSLRDEKQRLLVDLGQEKTRNAKLAAQLKQVERQLPGEMGKKEEAEKMADQLKDEVSTLKRELESCREKVVEAEARAREKESTVEDSLGHMQQELAKRAQQVLEMDGLLRNHQADTTARRLQLERTLAQRQSELRSRTQEVEELTVKLSEARKKMSELEQHMREMKMEKERADSEQKKVLQDKDSELSLLKERLKEVESLGVSNSQEMGHLKSELGSVCQRESEWRRRCEEMERKMEQLSSENDTLREHHLTQVQRLQDTHSSLLASREQQANSHRQQLQHLVNQERVRQEELSRCRAQVASLSAELAAERRVSEEARQQLAVARTEANRAKTQVASLQRSIHSTSTPGPTPTSTAVAPPTSGNSSSITSPSLPLHMLTRNTASYSPPSSHQSNGRSTTFPSGTTSYSTPAVASNPSSTSRNGAIIDV